MFRSLIQALPAYGPVLLFALICVESMGIPVPGETIVLASAAFAAAGRLSFVAVLIASILGGVLGGMGGYWIGRSGIARLVGRKRRAGLQRTTGFFDRHGGQAVVGGRFVAFVRSYLGIAAGMAGMPFRSFMLWNALGATVWAGCFSGLGYLFGRNLPRLERGLAAAGLVLAVLVAVTAVVAFLVRFAWPRRAEAGAVIERAWERLTVVPGPRGRIARAWDFITTRLSPMRFLVAYSAAGFAVSLIALMAFGGLLEDAIGGSALVRFDFALAAFAHRVSTPGGEQLAQVLSFLGSPLMLLLLCFSVVSRLLFARQRIPAFGWMASLGGSALIALALERVVRRPVPPIPEPFSAGAELTFRTPQVFGPFGNGAEFSFPSPHALGALVAYGMLAYLLATLRFERAGSRIAAAVAAAILVLAIGASRLYLGLEYFSDVVGGYAAGVVWLGACISGVELAWRQASPDPPA